MGPNFFKGFILIVSVGDDPFIKFFINIVGTGADIFKTHDGPVSD